MDSFGAILQTDCVHLVFIVADPENFLPLVKAAAATDRAQLDCSLVNTHFHDWQMRSQFTNQAMAWGKR